MVTRLASALCAALFVGLSLILASCSTVVAPGNGLSSPNEAQGTIDQSGKLKVGIVTMDRVDVLSDGVPASEALAVSLANASTAKAPITLLVRPVSADG